MASSLSNLVNGLSEGSHEITCKYRSDDKKCEKMWIKYEQCYCFPEYTNFKDDLVEYKCLCCDKNYQQKFDEELKERFFNTHNFLTTTIITYSYCCEKMLTLGNIWMIGKNSVKYHS